MVSQSIEATHPILAVVSSYLWISIQPCYMLCCLPRLAGRATALCSGPKRITIHKPVYELPKTPLLGASMNRGNPPLTRFNLTSERHTWFRIYGRENRAILWRGGRVVNAAGFKK